jgi:hypothetical protein
MYTTVKAGEALAAIKAVSGSRDAPNRRNAEAFSKVDRGNLYPVTPATQNNTGCHSSTFEYPFFPFLVGSCGSVLSGAFYVLLEEAAFGVAH